MNRTPPISGRHGRQGGKTRSRLWAGTCPLGRVVRRREHRDTRRPASADVDDMDGDGQRQAIRALFQTLCMETYAVCPDNQLEALANAPCRLVSRCLVTAIDDLLATKCTRFLRWRICDVMSQALWLKRSECANSARVTEKSRKWVRSVVLNTMRSLADRQTDAASRWLRVWCGVVVCCALGRFTHGAAAANTFAVWEVMKELETTMERTNTRPHVTDAWYDVNLRAALVYCVQKRDVCTLQAAVQDCPRLRRRVVIQTEVLKTLNPHVYATLVELPGLRLKSTAAPLSLVLDGRHYSVGVCIEDEFKRHVFESGEDNHDAVNSRELNAYYEGFLKGLSMVNGPLPLELEDDQMTLPQYFPSKRRKRVGKDTEEAASMSGMIWPKNIKSISKAQQIRRSSKEPASAAKRTFENGRANDVVERRLWCTELPVASMNIAWW